MRNYANKYKLCRVLYHQILEDFVSNPQYMIHHLASLSSHFDLQIANNLVSILICAPLRLDLVSSNSWKNFCPAGPVKHSQKQHADANNGEDVVWVTPLVPATFWR